jgi:ABC-type phosphate transport system substrate-binding protein
LSNHVNSLRFYLPKKNVILITSTEHRPFNRKTCERLIMKTIKYAVAAVALSALSFGAFAVEPVSSAQAQNMNKVGVVSADGATTLDGLEAKLAEKAAAAGASGYTITSANGNNKLSGTAVIYK